MSETAATSGNFTINIYDHWLYHFARMWGDIGRLHGTPIIRIHLKLPFLGTACDCWNCRAVAASNAAAVK